MRSGLDVPTFVTRRLHACHHARAPSGGKWNCGREMFENFAFHVTFSDLIHAVKLRHGTDGFTSPPKEGVLRISFAPKNPTASAGYEPANLGTKCPARYLQTTETDSSLLKNVNHQADEAVLCSHSINGQLLRTSLLTGRLCFCCAVKFLLIAKL